MRKILMITAVTLALGGAAIAAGEGRDPSSPSPDRVSGETIRMGLEGMGYRVDRIEFEHGCYEVGAVNDSGFPIRATYDATGVLIKARLR
jgi:hypothetical protein